MAKNNSAVKTPRPAVQQTQAAVRQPDTMARTLKNPNFIPRELWTYRQFVDWRYEDKGLSKLAKVPKNPALCGRLNPATGLPYSASTGPHWSKDWSDIRTAVAVYQTHDDLNGIGFFLTQGDPYVMVDVDDCLTYENDWFQLSIDAQAIVESLNTYTEVSPSGNGLRLLVHCKNQPQAIKKPEIEIYSNTRLCTLTGNPINSAPIKKVDDLDWFIDRFVPKEKEKSEVQLFPCGRQHVSPSSSDQDLWDRIRRINDFAYRLYQGDLSQVRGDHSVGVWYLLKCLAYQTNGDPVQMERMIRQSRLDQSKFDTKRRDWTWLQAMIQKAIKSEAGNL